MRHRRLRHFFDHRFGIVVHLILQIIERERGAYYSFEAMHKSLEKMYPPQVGWRNIEVLFQIYILKPQTIFFYQFRARTLAYLIVLI